MRRVPPPPPLHSNGVDAVLIDSDPFVAQCWRESAKNQRKTLRTFFSTQDFLGVRSQLKKEIPIFIDSDMNTKSENSLSKLLSSEGFTEIYITAAGPLKSVEFSKGLRGFRPKSPPWT